MSPGNRPIHPLPKPDQSTAPTAAISSPAITRNFPISLIAKLKYSSASALQMLRLRRHCFHFLETFLNERRALNPGQTTVKPTRSQQVLVRAPFDDLPVLHHQNLVGFPYCAEPMGYNKAGAIS